MRRSEKLKMKRLPYPASGLSSLVILLVRKHFPVWPLGVCVGRGGGGFSAQFSGIIIFSIDSYYRDLSCSKSITKSFVM